jgi:Zn-dependent protease
MFGSMKLGKFFGIDTYIHGTFWLLPLFVLFSNFHASPEQIAAELAFVFGLFFCVALHEIGHALAARAYGIRTRDITLYPIGGVASLERLPTKPWREVAVALAGPAVNVVIAIGLFGGVVLGDLVMPWTATPDVLEQFIGRLFWANVVLCLFNLLPAFPMDGGRILRAMLATRMDRGRATEIAVKVGTVVAALMLVAGVVRGDFALVAIAVVVWILSQAELARVRIRGALGARWVPVDPPESRSLPLDPDADLAARRFSGLAWDGKRRVWVQWAHGVPMRDLPS